MFLLCSGGKYNWLSMKFYLGIFSFLSVLYLYNPMLSVFNVSSFFYLDSLSSILLVLTVWVTSMMFISSQGVYLSSNKLGMFMFTVFFPMLVLFLTFCTFNILSFYVFFEMSLIPTLVLIIGWGYQPERLQAGMYLMLYTIGASLPLLCSLMYINYVSGSLFMMFGFTSLFMESGIESVWWFITIMAFMVKMPMYLTHLWLPKAHVEAPVSGSMILAGVLLKLGSYGLVRLSSLYIYGNVLVCSLFVSISMWGACMTSLICMRQMDLKSLIAYSSVGHMGLLISGVMSSQFWGLNGSLVMMVAHGLVSSGLFSIANMTYENTSTRSIYLTKGLLSILPSMSMFWFILSIMNMGAPPSINLLGEMMLLTSILSVSIYMAILIGVSSFLAAAYSLYLFTATHHGQAGLYINSMIGVNMRNISIIFFHVVPVFMFILCSQYITLWV